MNDLKLVLWRLPLTHVPETGNLAALDVDWAQNPAMLEHLSDGWVIKSHTLTALPDSLLLSLVLEKPITVPDTPVGPLDSATAARGLHQAARAGWSVADLDASSSHVGPQPLHRLKVDSGPGPLTPPPELLLWEDGTVTWDKPGHGPAART